MNPVEEHYLDLTRRRFFGTCAQSVSGAVGALALSSLLRAAANRPVPSNDGGGGVGAGAGGALHAAGQRVIYMHMEGALSQIDLFDYKPELRRRFNQDLARLDSPGARSQA